MRVPSKVALHFLPVNEKRSAKKTGRRKKRSSERVKGRSSTPEMYPQIEYNEVKTANKATYREIDDV